MYIDRRWANFSGGAWRGHYLQKEPFGSEHNVVVLAGSGEKKLREKIIWPRNSQ